MTGLAMDCEALRGYGRHLTMRFLANVDGSDLVEAPPDLDAGGDALHRGLGEG